MAERGVKPRPSLQSPRSWPLCFFGTILQDKLCNECSLWEMWARLKGTYKKQKRSNMLLCQDHYSFWGTFTFLQLFIVYLNFLRLTLPFSWPCHLLLFIFFTRLGCFQFLLIRNATTMSIYKHSLLLHLWSYYLD